MIDVQDSAGTANDISGHQVDAVVSGAGITHEDDCSVIAAIRRA